ncbi:MAG: choice-of-anchor J domain-containing protein [Fibrobacter sp.]|nr:choice-of-anchor J domain-containing protein [Fibrobacter sp.]
MIQNESAVPPSGYGTAPNYYKPDGYQHYILQIPSKYNGQTVYVAFQHVQINDPQLWINIDDVSVF